MVQQITEGVRIEVEAFFLQEQSNQLNSEYFYAYKITIENQSKYPIKLHSRSWNIIDSNGIHRVVEGEGVVGQQPIVEPGEQYQYTSACNLRTDIGKMYGYYVFENLFSKNLFRVTIPEFQLITPAKLN